ncbi:PREDICTED: probable adenylate kinase 7, mitochondrial [Nelumbo nucifera]|uniref:adenylate kinase n=2 Tax=Nelumbo nucifera TaxID=4432 RepID=A0A822Y968_NELNU|nr:PREDICTED: probable adenylate kinase 7, mitochondrial [Nelumbo nucifera]DAD30614.1 TPA_asm: hypothetical protein HUJ06_009465 [Nelumbo nucifera]
MAGICCRKAVAPHLTKWLRLVMSRSYGASAALQYDYDYYEEEEEEEDYGSGRDQRSAGPMADSEGSIKGRGVQWVFIGNPSARKHLYADRLSKILQVPHISMGGLVRQELNPRSSLYKQIANAVNQGKLVPEDIIFGLLSKRLEEGYYRGETGFILDGIPRTRIQAEILDQIADIDLVVNFKCSEDCLVKKHLGSGICSHCRESSLHESGLGSTSILKPSSPDTEDVRKEKLRIHAEQSKPLEDYYRKQKKLLDFEVANGPGETWQGLLAALHLKHINASHSSYKLTV